MRASHTNSSLSSFDRIVPAAREAAAAGAGEALAALGSTGRVAVASKDYGTIAGSPEGAPPDGALQAMAHRLGAGDDPAGLDRLKAEIAYQEWHRRLFARFRTACGRRDPAPAADFFMPDLARQVQFPPASGLALDRLVERLPNELFDTAENLGWMYQAWQNARKEVLQRSERKIGGRDLGPATQLFTESYLVRFLLENTLGAWWAARRPGSPLLKEMRFLRWREDGPPAAGRYPTWPEHAVKISVLDPCCGTGHFLLAAFHLLRKMRMEEEGLGEAEAAIAVLQDNLFGLDLDPHCVEIARLVLCLEAWRVGAEISPLGLNILPVDPALFGLVAESAIDLAAVLADPLASRLRNLMEQFPEAGSLLDPSNPVFDTALGTQIPTKQGNLAPGGRSGEASRAQGPGLQVHSPVASLLSRQYVLVATNVPYLARRKQSQGLREFLQRYYPLEKADLATAFLRRSLQFLQPGGAAALVTPQNWLFLGAYRAMRRELLASCRLDFLVKIGEWGFRSAHAAGAFTALVGLSAVAPQSDGRFFGLDASRGRRQAEKSHQLQAGPLQYLSQATQAEHPDARIVLAEIQPGRRLGDYARSLVGLQTGDNPYYMLRFWELDRVKDSWEFCLTPAGDGDPYGGRECILRWEAGRGRLQNDPGARIQGLEALGCAGVAVLRVRAIRAFHYAGELYDQNVAIILPHDPAHLPAIWAFCASDEFSQAVRRIDQKLNVTNATLTKVPFDLERWQREAGSIEFPPVANHRDPRQWLFAGDPAGSGAPLQVAVARLLGYRWPSQPPDRLDEFTVPGGILPLPAIGDRLSGAQQLRRLLAAAYGSGWSRQWEAQLLAEAGHPGLPLERWLQDRFFAGHCRLFRNRPFIWQVWDGCRDGFSVLVSYHQLSRTNLDRLIEVTLAEWIERQAWEVRAGRPGAAERLDAAQALHRKLAAISAGELPYDIYARWKPLAQQPPGWNPDLNDGVRVNLRPFVTAGVLRARFNIHWSKDRGLDQDGSERLNDLHFTREAKQAARLDLIQPDECGA